MWNIFGDGPLEWSEDADAAQYARIDGLIDASGDFLINEVELIEPALYLSLHPPALDALRELASAD